MPNVPGGGRIPSQTRMSAVGAGPGGRDSSPSRRIQASSTSLLDTIDRLSSGREVFFHHIKYVEDLVNTTVEPLKLDDPVHVGWKRMEDEGLADLPIVDVEGDTRRGVDVKKTFVGTLRKKDLCAMLSQFAGTLSQLESDDRTLKGAISSTNCVDRTVPPLVAEMSLFDAIDQMIRTGVETLAVVGDNALYLGSLSVHDILRCFNRLEVLRRARNMDLPQETRLVDLLSSQEKALPTDMMLGTFLGRAQDVMRESVATITLTESIDDGIRLMEQKRTTVLFVVDQNGNLKGIVTSNDLQLALPPIQKKGREGSTDLFYLNRDAPDTRQVLNEKIATAMKAHPAMVSAEEPILKLAERLQKPGFEHLPVVAAPKNRPRGIVSRADLLRALMALGQLAKKRGLLEE